MKYRRYTDQEVVEKTREAIHMFIRKQMDSFVKLLDEDFVWIGDYEPLYMRGIPAFLESVREEMQELPVKLSDEEYSLLSHERYLWITYGRFTAMSCGLSTRIHFTFVWRQRNDDLLLLHANANHAQKAPQAAAQSKIFGVPSNEELKPYSEEAKKLTFRSQNGSIHYLLAEEIRYIKANNKFCTIFMQGDSFSTRITLKDLVHPPFLQIHKSYIVNLCYLREISRYRATLLDGTQLPIGKEFYMNLKQYLLETGTVNNL